MSVERQRELVSVPTHCADCTRGTRAAKGEKKTVQVPFEDLCVLRSLGVETTAQPPSDAFTATVCCVLSTRSP